MPRELGRTRIGELQQLLLKEDHYIPGIPNADPLDLARGARVTATSGNPAGVLDGTARQVGDDVHG